MQKNGYMLSFGEMEVPKDFPAVPCINLLTAELRLNQTQ